MHLQYSLCRYYNATKLVPYYRLCGVPNTDNREMQERIARSLIYISPCLFSG